MSREGSREYGGEQQAIVHLGCFQPGICLFYGEPEPLASQVSVLIPSEKICGVGPGVLAPGPWPVFPVASRSQLRLGWAGLRVSIS